MLEVLWSPTPGAKLTRLSHTVLSNTIGCPCNQGLYFVRFEFARAVPDCERTGVHRVRSVCFNYVQLINVPTNATGGLYTWWLLQLEVAAFDRGNRLHRLLELLDACGAAQRSRRSHLVSQR
eukprot:COSAG01_NODE_1326_length_10718_cov_11.125718_3_plen_122_part_00